MVPGGCVLTIKGRRAGYHPFCRPKGSCKKNSAGNSVRSKKCDLEAVEIVKNPCKILHWANTLKLQILLATYYIDSTITIIKFHTKVVTTNEDFNRKIAQIAISQKRHFRSQFQNSENTFQYKLPPKTWEKSPQKPLSATRKWFFGHCYV